MSYVLALVFTLVFVVVGGYNPHPAFIAFFIALMLLLILGCVVISNMYQDMYTTNDDVTIIMKEHVLLSWLILHQPMIFTVIILTSGIIMFSGMKEEDMI